jgi:predicted RNA-binding Zn ribbon-like protein
MKPLFLGSHPAADFLNTLATPRDGPVEFIGDGRSFAAWLEDAALLQGSSAAKLERRFGVEALDAAAADARKLREWARGWISRWREAPRRDYAPELQRLNRTLERARRYRQVVAAAGGLQLRELDRIESADDLIAIVAAQIAALVANEDPELVKRCAGAGCSLWFVDRTKAHGRLFCSAAACGNRAKVAAFRERQRTTAR